MSVTLEKLETNCQELKATVPEICVRSIEKFVMGSGRPGDGMISRNYLQDIAIVVGRLHSSLVTYWGGGNSMTADTNSATLSYDVSCVKYASRILDGGPIMRVWIPEIQQWIVIRKTHPRPVHYFDAVGDKAIDAYVQETVDRIMFG